jgi:hypothetical protein
MTTTFTLSIEETAGNSFLHGFHLGTDERLARQIAEEVFNARVKYGQPIVTVALIRDRKLVDVFDGTWSYDHAADLNDGKMKDFRNYYTINGLSVVYVPTGETLSNHETLKAAKAQIKRYVAADERRMKQRFIAGRSAG